MNTQEASTVDTLTMGERAYLGRLEQTIENGLQTYIDVGSALEEIRARKLYRGAHATFEDYCRDRWKISRIHAHRLIQAAELAANLLPMGNIPPDNERQARALAHLPPAYQAAVLEMVRAEKGDDYTADDLSAAAKLHVARQGGDTTTYDVPAQFVIALADGTPIRCEYLRGVLGSADEIRFHGSVSETGYWRDYLWGRPAPLDPRSKEGLMPGYRRADFPTPRLLAFDRAEWLPKHFLEALKKVKKAGDVGEIVAEEPAPRTHRSEEPGEPDEKSTNGARAGNQTEENRKLESLTPSPDTRHPREEEARLERRSLAVPDVEKLQREIAGLHAQMDRLKQERNSLKGEIQEMHKQHKEECRRIRDEQNQERERIRTESAIIAARMVKVDGGNALTAAFIECLSAGEIRRFALDLIQRLNRVNEIEKAKTATATADPIPDGAEVEEQEWEMAWGHCDVHDCDYLHSEGCDDCRDAAQRRRRDAEEPEPEEEEEPMPDVRETAFQAFCDIIGVAPIVENRHVLRAELGKLLGQPVEAIGKLSAEDFKAAIAVYRRETEIEADL